MLQGSRTPPVDTAADAWQKLRFPITRDLPSRSIAVPRVPDRGMSEASMRPPLPRNTCSHALLSQSLSARAVGCFQRVAAWTVTSSHRFRGRFAVQQGVEQGPRSASPCLWPDMLCYVN